MSELAQQSDRQKSAPAHRTNQSSLLDIYRHEQMHLKTFDQKVELMREVLPEHAHLSPTYIERRKQEIRRELLRIKAGIIRYGADMSHQEWKEKTQTSDLDLQEASA